MLCQHCNTQIEDGAAFCGTCGKPVTPQTNNGETVIGDKTVADHSLAPKVSSVAKDDQAYRAAPSPKTSLQASYLSSNHPASVAPSPKQVDTPPVLPQPPRRNNVRRNILLIALLIVLIAGGTIATALVLHSNNGGTSGTATKTVTNVVATASGQVAFIDSPNSTPGQTNSLKIAINGLTAPASGSQYMAWLINDQSEQITPLGALVANGQKFSLTYTGGNTGPTNLLGLGDKIEVTVEQGQVSAPTGKVILTGIFPPKAFVHIRHLLFKFPTTPGNVGLLVGLMNQTQLLNGQALILQNTVAGGNQAAIKCAAQSIIDISEGTTGNNYKPLGTDCATLNITQTGDGFGILGNGYLLTASSHASLAANQSDTTQNIRTHANHVIIATDNIKGWVTTVDQDALKLLSNPSDTSVMQEIVTLADHAYHGVDINGDEQIDPVPGEAGAITAYIHGQLMAALPLVANR